nr:Mbeg1-like protein [uncultured Kingella sp.]
MKMTEKEYAQLASRVYDRKDIRNKMTLPEGVTELEWQDDDKWTGFSAGVYQVAENHIVISFTGSNEELIEDFLLNNIPIGLGYSGPQVEDAARLTFQVMEKYPNAKIEFTGHSLGGGLASMMAILFNKKAYVFDPAPFKAAVLNPFRLRRLNGLLIKNGRQNSFRLPYECVPVAENIRKAA